MKIAIDWSKLITAEQKKANELAAQTAAANAQLTVFNRTANTQVTALQERVSTLNDPDMQDEYTDEEIAELPVRQSQLKDWKNYRLLLGRVSKSDGWPAKPNWPKIPELYVSESASLDPSTAA